MLSKLSIRAAQYTPQFLKSWVHHNRSFDFLSRKLFARMLGSGVISIPDGPMKGIRLACGPHVSHAHLRGVYERETQEAADHYVKPGFVCYDLGASIGYLSLLMARKARHVFAFEPAPHAAAEIRRHMAANGIENITIVPNPVSSDEREVSFVLTDVAFGSSINETETRWPVLKVRTTTLDRFLEDHPGPDFIKIDIEGEEGKALAGARTLLAKHRPVICCELHSAQAAREVQAALRDFSYTIRTLDGRDFVIAGDVIPGEVQVMCLPNEFAG